MSSEAHEYASYGEFDIVDQHHHGELLRRNGLVLGAGHSRGNEDDHVRHALPVFNGRHEIEHVEQSALGLDHLG
eukprot:CAMPEP_0113907214 /NCGR_PEP_ID=MMETSP0780_2-20120614/25323_1 /TAXON_ID=652834 /ORGANISM="Palpitomonas bilix" /LENGTH=73 /DNA_ID=CAMNT_0000902189 /DNA_START=147 /DNA_END=365 /DNA_ORIENTATION=+ /assembly_acc=CAM_ASM_000599